MYSSQQLNCFRLKFCNCCLWIWRLSTWRVTSSYAVLMIQETLQLRHYTAYLLYWPSEPQQKNKWVWPGIATISDNRQHCKKHIITKYVVLRISRWITSSCPSLLSEKKLFEPFWIYFAWRLSSSFCSWGYMVWKKMLVEEFQDGFSMLHPFDIFMEWFLLFCVTYLPAASHQVSAQEHIWFGRGWCLEKFQDGCLVLGNLWYANGMIGTTSESPCGMKPSIKLVE